MSSINEILKEVISLPEDQRLTLVNRILMHNETHMSDDISNAWDLEIRNRIERYDRGEIGSRPASKVFSDLDRRLK